MSLVLSEEETMIRDTANDFLSENAGPDMLRKLRDQDDPCGYSKVLWEKMADLGWPSLLIPEEFGGLDFSHTAMGQITQQVGVHLATTPLFSTGILAAEVLKKSKVNKNKEKLLPLIAEGKVKIAVALEEGSRYEPAVINTRLDSSSNGYLLNGNKRNVLDGGLADYLIVVCRHTSKGEHIQGDLGFLILDANKTGIEIKNNMLIDSRMASIVTFNNVEILEDEILKFEQTPELILENLLSTANIYLSAELLGVSQKAFELTIEYLKTRTQFGVKIGSFQALQHRASHLWAEIELCKSIVLKALRALDRNTDDIAKLSSFAKAKTSKISEVATNEGIQMHGGIGMTDEFYMGFYLKRARVAQMLFGDWKYHTDQAATLSGY